jgi:hypothetical protein
MFRDLEAMPVQEAGEPVGAGEDLAVDPGVARVLSQFGRCGRGAEELAEAGHWADGSSLRSPIHRSCERPGRTMLCAHCDI